MGTVYTVRVVGASRHAVSGLERDIVRRLEEINAAMSVYRPESQISRFNALIETDHALPVSQDFQNVLRESIRVHELTAGAFDPTVKPLLDLWGFGPAAEHAPNRRPPHPRDVDKALEAVGLHLIDASDPARPRKLHPRVQLDFGAVAKGYAVDQIADLLRQKGIDDYLVDIGGDIRVSGNNADREAWRVGVNRPVREGAWDDVLMVLNVRDQAVVSSGDYRQFFHHEGRSFSHILDPRTGRPADNRVAAVTVLADTAAFADALATGLMVMGAEAGLELVESLIGVEALLIIRDDSGLLEPRMSQGFHAAAGCEGSDRELR